ncbi:ubiquitin-conjugating enzyme/RWD-like protein [Kockovaella imperatae]|uniref:E2 ubiquitin-conjugating enzyme n=1 Tax=Kockovaella imperatae TaxID=4999 RepID=A0A1Y1UDK5_9TREE|nr:ubiquitin-conjugating enzyme/RWD-like protein [Kockovaella imperatae]ORX36120.1 ubiquitin-conjugating enzyme/RWD-like protein [Kockovaella imperatae]
MPAARASTGSNSGSNPSRDYPSATAPTSRPASARTSTPNQSNTANSSLILRRQLLDLQKHPVDGFSAGLVDESNILEWQIVIIGPADTLYEGAILKARLIFPEEYPILPPRMVFDTEMWHPNVYNKGDKKGEVCVSILHQPGEDEWGYEDAGERWLPVHSVESVLISVISLLSADVPDLNSPANVDAAKEVREDFPGYKKKVKRLARKSAEEACD